MNICSLFIRRPVATTLIMLGLLFFGILGYENLPVSDMPNVDFPTISVSATLAGADPETMAASVAMPLERRLSAIAGIDSMTSVSTQGSTRIVLQFDLDRDIDAAAQDVQSAISLAQRRMPPDMTSPPSYRKVNPSAAPILLLAFTSSTLPLYELNEYAETLIAQRLSMVTGVAEVMVYGTRKYAVRIQLDPDLLASRGIGVDEAADAVSEANSNLPTGTLQGRERASSVKTTGRLYNAADFKNVVVAWRNGAPVRLGELGDVIDDAEENRQINWYNNVPGIVLAVQRRPGTNTIAVVDEIRSLLPRLQAQIPASVSLNIMYDRSLSIRESVHDVKLTLVLTIFLVIGIIFLFLRNAAATLIPSLALPLSIMATFAVMYACGFSVDNLSLMALTLAVGFVVDDAIVMLENIVRHREMGKTPFRAALDGSEEIGFTILSMTISLAAVFIPVMFMSGVVGRLFHEFAVVIVVAILFSGVVSLTLTPMLCAWFLRSPARSEAPQAGFYGVLEKGFEGLFRLYEKALYAVMRHRLTTLLLSFVLLAGTTVFFVLMPKGFLPDDDTGMLSGYTQAEQSISYPGMVARQSALHPILSADPAIRAFSSVVGAGGPNTSMSTGRFNISLKPRSERGHINEVLARLRKELNVLPGLQVFLSNPPVINIGGRSSQNPYQYTLQGSDTTALFETATKVEAALRNLPEFIGVTSDLQIKSPEIIVNIDRDKAAALGVTVRQIETALQVAFASKEVSTIYTSANDYSVRMEVKPEFQESPRALSLLYVRSSNGTLTPLDAVASITRGVGALSINHSGQIPSVTVSFALRPDVSLSKGVELAEEVARPLLPDSVTASFQGTAQAFQKSLSGMAVLLILAVVVIYIVLGVLYESFIHPLTILSGLPSAAFGALLTLWLFKLDLNLYAFVGIIMLIGIVKKNAIMMLDFALEAERKHNLSPEQAVIQGCLIRFRPIMMTTMAAIMGALPIAAGIGAGAEARRPLGLAVVGGLLISQVVTLFLTPVYYVYLDRFGRWAGKLFKARAAEARTEMK